MRWGFECGEDFDFGASGWKGPLVSPVEMLGRKQTGSRGWGEIPAADRHPR